eukprot:gnl/MRDRNA2_/MRDRNA2_37512_c0_seq1.p1 gnl/MRDRNA2_/MRDRNA2_37512_c0~~gnl/MRDRNA2_/MRDRNA2_37512_c0_seq1.p1  ORF type:complete len:255 (+),score=44.19 gnl/MRDRNA2_/MRDRNA2_37512_c0_seq1:2-766(+)
MACDGKRGEPYSDWLMEREGKAPSKDGDCKKGTLASTLPFGASIIMEFDQPIRPLKFSTVNCAVGPGDANMVSKYYVEGSNSPDATGPYVPEIWERILETKRFYPSSGGGSQLGSSNSPWMEFVQSTGQPCKTHAACELGAFCSKVKKCQPKQDILGLCTMDAGCTTNFCGKDGKCAKDGPIQLTVTGYEGKSKRKGKFARDSKCFADEGAYLGVQDCNAKDSKQHFTKFAYGGSFAFKSVTSGKCISGGKNSG